MEQELIKFGKICQSVFMEELHVSKFSIVTYAETKPCEECNVSYPSGCNFTLLACCGEPVRFCFNCSWVSVPCRLCRENNHGAIKINKVQNRGEKERKIVEVVQYESSV